MTRVLVLAMLLAGCAVASLAHLSARSQGCDMIVDDTLGTMPRVHGGPAPREEIGTGFVCRWALE